MKHLILFLSLFSDVSFASEYTVSFALKHIQMPHALDLFNTQTLPTQNTIGQELAAKKINLLFSRENGSILLHGTNKENVDLVRELIQNHIDKV